jgi:hypothetical protein
MSSSLAGIPLIPLDWSFKFSKIQHNASQATVYRECVEDVVKQVFEGYNGTIMAYGQTGVGLAFTNLLDSPPRGWQDIHHLGQQRRHV